MGWTEDDNERVYVLQNSAYRLQGVGISKAEDMVGSEVLMMVEGKVADENVYVGRTYKDAPNVDGLIFVHTDAELITGDFAKVKVTGALEYDLIGELM